MNKVLILMLALISFRVNAQYEGVQEILIADILLPPVMVYVKASKSKSRKYKAALQKYIEDDPELCDLDSSKPWYCIGRNFKSIRVFQGLDGDGKFLHASYVCGGTYDVPKQKYYTRGYLLGYECIEVWYPVKDKVYVTFPEDA